MTPAKRTVEVLNGVGKYTILGEADKPLYTTDKMKDYTVDESGKNPVVTVHYALSDNAGDVTAIYTLYKEYMDVEISLENYSGKDAASAYYVGNSQRNIRRWKSGVSERGNSRKTMIFHIQTLTVLPGSTDLKMVEVCIHSMKARRHSPRII